MSGGEVVLPIASEEERAGRPHRGPPVVEASDSAPGSSPDYFRSSAFQRTFLRVARRPLLWHGAALLVGVPEVCLAALWAPWPHLVGIALGSFLIVVSVGRVYYLHRTFNYGARPSADSVSRPLLRPAARRPGGRRRTTQMIFDWAETSAIVATLVLLLINIASRATPPTSRTFPGGCPSSSGCYRVDGSDPMFPDAPGAPVWPDTTIECAARAVARRSKIWLGPPEEMDPTPAGGAHAATFHYVAVSAGLGVPDDVYIHFRCLNSSVQLQFHSQARLAVYDLGANRRRARWLARKFRVPKWSAAEQAKCSNVPCDGTNDL